MSSPVPVTAPAQDPAATPPAAGRWRPPAGGRGRMLGQIAAIALCGVLAYFLFTSGYQRLVAASALVNVILALSLLLTSFTNRLSLAQAALAGVGAYASGYLATESGVNPILAILVGALLATVFGTLLGLLSLRLRGFYFAIATIAFSQIFSVVVSGWTTVTGGLGGLNGIPPLPDFSLGPVSLVYSFDTSLTGYYFTLLLVVCIAVAIALVMTGDTRVGRRVQAVGDDDVLALSLGVPATRLRTVAFAIGAFLAGIAGGLQGSLLAGAAPSSYDTFASVMILAMVYIGGHRSVTGAVVGAVLLTAVSEGMKMAASWQLVFYGAFFLLVAFFLPRGLVPTVVLLARGGWRRVLSRPVRPRTEGAEG